MRLCGKIDNSVKAFLKEKRFNGFSVGDVALDKAEVFAFQRPFKRFKISGIGQRVKADYAAVRVLFKLIIDEI